MKSGVIDIKEGQLFKKEATSGPPSSELLGGLMTGHEVILTAKRIQCRNSKIMTYIGNDRRGCHQLSDFPQCVPYRCSLLSSCELYPHPGRLIQVMAAHCSSRELVT